LFIKFEKNASKTKKFQMLFILANISCSIKDTNLVFTPKCWEFNSLLDPVKGIIPMYLSFLGKIPKFAYISVNAI
jgi:hypothetical protein